MQCFTFAVLASSLVASASAGSLHAHHARLHEKKHANDVWMPADTITTNQQPGCTTVTTTLTYTSTLYGGPSLVPDTPSSSSTVSTSSSEWVAPTTYSSSRKQWQAPTRYSNSSGWVAPAAWSASSEWAAPITLSPGSQWVPSTVSSASSHSAWVTSTASSSSSEWVAPTTSSSELVAPLSSTSSWKAEQKWGAPSYSAPASPSAASTAEWTSSAVSSSAVSTSPAASPSSSSGSSGTISPNGNLWAMTYTPYKDDGSCKQLPQVLTDIAAIAAKGFTTIRMYGTDCSGPEKIGQAAKLHNMKVILAIYVGPSGIGQDTDDQVDSLTSWGQGQWDMVEMIVFGNEAVYSGYTDVDTLAGAISSARGSFTNAGYSGPVTTTDTVGVIQQYNSTLCPVIDVVAANIHPFFSTGTTPEDAGTFVASQLEDVAKACGNEKEAYNLETGWPTKGSADGAAIPGFPEQREAIKNIVASAGKKSAIFSFSNDYWKNPGNLGVEQYWGCADLFSG